MDNKALSLKAVKDNFNYDIIIEFLNWNSILISKFDDMFIGGSKRFKYDNNNSDIDIFIYSELDVSDIRRILYKNGFRENDEYIEFPGKSTGWTIKEYNCHLVVIGDKQYYELIKKDHQKVEDYLDRNSSIRQAIKILKLFTPMKGSAIYKALKQMILLEPNKVS